MWTPDVYEGAPAPVTAFMSAAVKAAAFVAFLRVFMVGLRRRLRLVVPGHVVAGRDHDGRGEHDGAGRSQNVKRMLAYSSIAHAGYLLVAMTAANETAAAGLLFYLLVYTVMNIGAFAIVIGVAHQAEERLQVEDYAGFGWAQPTLGVLLTIFLLSLAGFPGTGGFMGKIYLLQGAADAQLWYLSVVLVLTTIASYWYYLRVAWFMWMKREISDDQHDLVIVPLPMRHRPDRGRRGRPVHRVLPRASALDFARASVEGLGAAGGTMPGTGAVVGFPGALRIGMPLLQLHRCP